MNKLLLLLQMHLMMEPVWLGATLLIIFLGVMVKHWLARGKLTPVENKAQESSAPAASRAASATPAATTSDWSDIQVPKSWFAHFYATASVVTLILMLDLGYAFYSANVDVVHIQSTSATTTTKPPYLTPLLDHVILPTTDKALRAMPSTLKVNETLIKMIDTLAPNDLELPKRQTSSSSGVSSHQLMVMVAMSMVLLQVSSRFFEQLWVFKTASGSTMHITVYLGGIGFYILMPFSIYLSSFYTRFEGMSTNSGSVGSYYLFPPSFWGGILIFLIGWCHQRICHKILGNLRKGSGSGSSSGSGSGSNSQGVETQVKMDQSKKRGDKNNNTNRNTDSVAKRYGTPRGSWFEYVVCPHYFAEVLLYSGIAVCIPTRVTFWIVIFVLVNLGITARETLVWYQEQSKTGRLQQNAIHNTMSETGRDNFPGSRKAMIPFIF